MACFGKNESVAVVEPEVTTEQALETYHQLKPAEPKKDMLPEQIALAEKLGMTFQVKILKAQQAGFTSETFNRLLLEMGWGYFRAIDRVDSRNTVIAERRNEKGNGTATRLTIGKIEDYGLPLMHSILCAIEQNKEHGLFDELAIIAPLNHFAPDSVAASDPYLVGVIWNDSHTEKFLFPILRWE